MIAADVDCWFFHRVDRCQVEIGRARGLTDPADVGLTCPHRQSLFILDLLVYDFVNALTVKCFNLQFKRLWHRSTRTNTCLLHLRQRELLAA